jgi:hypothetical protein
MHEKYFEKLINIFEGAHNFPPNTSHVIYHNESEQIEKYIFFSIFNISLLLTW